MTEQDKPKFISFERAVIKAQKYCAYQERSQQEVRDKLYDWGLHRNEVEQLIADLISDSFLKEERFAQAFAQGKFRIKKWGRLKIEQALKQKKISEPLIKQAIRHLDDREYRNELEKLIRKRMLVHRDENPYMQNAKTAAYVIRKGYEPELVWEILRNE